VDLITYFYGDGNTHMLFEDSKPGVVFDIGGSEIVVETANGKKYIHFRKPNGVSVTLTMDSENENELAKKELNHLLESQGHPDVDTLMARFKEENGEH
jgi:predicted SpoU family rRNA methylase